MLTISYVSNQLVILTRIIHHTSKIDILEQPGIHFDQLVDCLRKQLFKALILCKERVVLSADLVSKNLLLLKHVFDSVLLDGENLNFLLKRVFTLNLLVCHRICKFFCNTRFLF